MMPSRGMGAVNPSKMPGAKRMARRDDTDFTQYKKGGRVKKYAGGDVVEDSDAREEQKSKVDITPKITGVSPSKISGKLGAAYSPNDNTKLSLDADMAMRKFKGAGVDGLTAKVNQKLNKDSDLSAYANLTPGRGVTRGGVNYNYRFDEGGEVKSKVNEAGNYTKPSLRKRIVSQVMAAATQGTGAGKWSARKAQLVAKKYKAAGGGYRD